MAQRLGSRDCHYPGHMELVDLESVRRRLDCGKERRIGYAENEGARASLAAGVAMGFVMSRLTPETSTSAYAPRSSNVLSTPSSAPVFNVQVAIPFYMCCTLITSS